MAFVNYAVMDMDITAWTVKGSCHGIFTSLHADSIVSRLECTVMDVAEYLAEDKDKVQSKRKWMYRAVKEIPDDFIIEDGVIKRVKIEEVK